MIDNRTPAPVQGRGLTMIIVVAAVLLLAAPVHAAFTASTTTVASLASDTLDPPTGLSVGSSCAAGRTAPTYRSASSASSGGPSVTVNLPAGTQAGDVLVAMAIGMSNPGEITFTNSTWNLLHQPGNNSQDILGASFWRRATAAEPASHTFQMGDPDPGAVIIAAYSAVDSVTAVDASAGQFNNNLSSAVVPSITTTTAATRLVSGVAVEGPATVAAPTGQTQRRMQTVSGGVLGLADESFATVGASGTRSVSLGSNRYSAGMAVALRGVPTPTVNVSWTATADTYATGYELVRTGGATVTTAISGRNTVAASDTAVSSATSYTYTLRSVYGSWKSTAVAGAVTTC